MKSVRAAAILLSLVCTPGTLATLGGCQLQGVCQASFTWYDDYLEGTTSTNIHEPLPTGAGVYDATHWESGPIDGPWIDYSGQRSIFLFPNLVPSATGAPPALPGNFPGPYTEVHVYVSADQDANAPGNNWTEASGNIAEVTVAGPTPDDPNAQWFVAVTNATCAQYYVRVVVERAGPAASTSEDGGTDGGVTADASVDAPADASVDAPLD